MLHVSRSYAHLRATFDEYQKLTKKDIEESIKSEMSGDIKNAMLTIGTSELYSLIQWRHYFVLCSESGAKPRRPFCAYAVQVYEGSGYVWYQVYHVLCRLCRLWNLCNVTYDTVGTDDETLIRIVVSRSEVDMVQIKENFQTMQQQSLGQFVKVIEDI